MQRDPISIQFDPAAARLLRRAYEAGGGWAGTYVRNPSLEWQAWAARRGISLLGPDDQPGGMSKTRWARAFVRSVYYLHRWHYTPGRGLVLEARRASPWGRPLQYQVNSVRILTGGVVAGRQVRIRTRPGGQAAGAAVDDLPYSRRIYAADGQPAGRHTTPADRDW